MEVYQIHPEDETARLLLGSAEIGLSDLIRGSCLVDEWLDLTIPDEAVEFQTEEDKANGPPRVSFSASVSSGFISDEQMMSSNILDVVVEGVSPVPAAWIEETGDVVDDYSVSLLIPIGAEGETLNLVATSTAITEKKKKEEEKKKKEEMESVEESEISAADSESTESPPSTAVEETEETDRASSPEEQVETAPVHEIAWNLNRSVYLTQDAAFGLVELLEKGEGLRCTITAKREKEKPKDKTIPFEYSATAVVSLRGFAKPGQTEVTISVPLVTVVPVEEESEAAGKKGKKGKAKESPARADVFEEAGSVLSLSFSLQAPLIPKRKKLRVDDVVVPDLSAGIETDAVASEGVDVKRKEEASQKKLDHVIGFIVKEIQRVSRENADKPFEERMKAVRSSRVSTLLRTKLREAIVETISATRCVSDDGSVKDIDQEANKYYAVVMKRIGVALEQGQSEGGQEGEVTRSESSLSSTSSTVNEGLSSLSKSLDLAHRHTSYDCPGVAERYYLDVISSLQVDAEKGKDLTDVCRVWCEYATFCSAGNDKKKAEACYQHVLSLSPQHVDANLGMALLLLEEDLVDEAHDFIITAWEGAPNEPVVVASKALYHMLAEEDDEWIKAEETAFETLGRDASISSHQTIMSTVSQALCVHLSAHHLNRLVLCSVLRDNVSAEGTPIQDDMNRAPSSTSLPSSLQSIYLGEAFSRVGVASDKASEALVRVNEIGSSEEEESEDRLKAVALQGHIAYGKQEWENAKSSFGSYLSLFREADLDLSTLDGRVLYRLGVLALRSSDFTLSRQLFQQLNDLPLCVSSHTLSMYALACTKEAQSVSNPSSCDSLLFTAETALSSAMAIEPKSPSIWGVLSLIDRTVGSESDADSCRVKALSLGLNSVSTADLLA